MSAPPPIASRRARLRFAGRLAARFARSPALARSTAVVFVAGAFLLAMFVTLHTLTLSGAQVAERDLGRFGASLGYGTIVARPGDAAVTARLARAAREAGARDIVVTLSATDVQLVAGEAQGTPREVTLQEAPWTSKPFARRYELLAGRWPRRAGEVVLTEPADVAGSPGTRLAALGGAAQLDVVGTAEDRYARTSALLAAPGTWAALSPRLDERFGLLQAQATLFWDGGATSAVVAAFTAVARGEGAAVNDAAVAATLSTRETLAAHRGRTWIARVPAGYAIPSLLLPLAALALVFGLNDRRFRRSVRLMTAMGIRLFTAVASLALATAAWCLLAAAAGAGAGTLLGLAAREGVARVRGLPAGPVSDLGWPLLSLLGVVAAGAVCAGLVLYTSLRARPAGRTGATARRAPSSRGRSARRLAALAVWCVTVRLALSTDSPPDAMILAGVLTAGVLLLVPELLAIVLRALPERGARTRLSRRQLAADRGRAGAAVAVLAVLLGGSLGYLTLLSTLVRTADGQAHPDVLPGQLLVSDRANILRPPEPAVLRAVRASAVARDRPRLAMRYLHELDATGNPRRSAALEGTTESIVAADSVAGVGQLLARPLTRRQEAVLRAGGILGWADAAGPARVAGSRARLASTSPAGPVAAPIELPATTVDVDAAGWRVGTSSVLLTSTARALDLPLTTGATVFAGLSADEARMLQAAVSRAGLDAKAIQRYAPPPPPVPPAALLASAVGLVVLALLASLVATTGQGRILRGYLGRLVSIGLPTRWARQVLLLQQVVIVAVATAVGLLIAIPPVIVATLRISGFELSIPWTQVVVLLACIYAATLLAALHASRRLRARGDAIEHAPARA